MAIGPLMHLSPVPGGSEGSGASAVVWPPHTDREGAGAWSAFLRWQVLVTASAHPHPTLHVTSACTAACKGAGTGLPLQRQSRLLRRSKKVCRPSSGGTATSPSCGCFVAVYRRRTAVKHFSRVGWWVAGNVVPIPAQGSQIRYPGAAHGQPLCVHTGRPESRAVSARAIGPTG